jgi:hypothetical protein
MVKKIFYSIEQVEKEFFPKSYLNRLAKRKMEEHKKGGPAGKCPYCGKEMVKHIIEEGARYHVTSWSLRKDKDWSGTKCSELNCENNHGPGHCVPYSADPMHGLSHEERIKRIFETPRYKEQS